MSLHLSTYANHLLTCPHAIKYRHLTQGWLAVEEAKHAERVPKKEQRIQWRHNGRPQKRNIELQVKRLRQQLKKLNKRLGQLKQAQVGKAGGSTEEQE
uniref:Uncharacterized protein n=1 Tax=Mycena chlorophos TaxID=658473 RepID=A0ABQ0LQQ9_MYCCL|nr:predicted protein [Mycena chlorophos]